MKWCVIQGLYLRLTYAESFSFLSFTLCVEAATLLSCLTSVGCFPTSMVGGQSWQPADYLPLNHQRQQVKKYYYFKQQGWFYAPWYEILVLRVEWTAWVCEFLSVGSILVVAILIDWYRTLWHKVLLTAEHRCKINQLWLCKNCSSTPLRIFARREKGMCGNITFLPYQYPDH